jgi:hypothetical protein
VQENEATLHQITPINTYVNSTGSTESLDKVMQVQPYDRRCIPHEYGSHLQNNGMLFLIIMKLLANLFIYDDIGHLG